MLISIIVKQCVCLLELVNVYNTAFWIITSLTLLAYLVTACKDVRSIARLRKPGYVELRDVEKSALKPDLDAQQINPRVEVVVFDTVLPRSGREIQEGAQQPEFLVDKMDCEASVDEGLEKEEASKKGA